MPSIALREIHKRFGETVALRGASLDLAPGEIHALLGENGAGKTTLVRTLCGLHAPDSGRIEIDAEPVEIASPRHAQALGIGLVHQHFMGVPALSVAENLVLGESGGFALRPRHLRERARETLERWGLDVHPDTPARKLSVGQLQRLEIARVLDGGVEALVLDEPTAVLAPSEVGELLALLERLRDQGRSVVLISHKLEEVTAVCDRVSVLRAGRTVASREVAGLDASQIGEWMVGRALPPRGRPTGAPPGRLALRLSSVRTEGLRRIDLDLRRGEVLAVAGIDGNGQLPLEELLAGVRPLEAGELSVPCPPLTLVSGDRQRTGLALDLSLEENLALPAAAKPRESALFRYGLLKVGELRTAAGEAINRHDIRAEARTLARQLSGGNQQKLCIARALRSRPGVLVVVNPTRGLDVQAAAAVREELRELARGGTAVLLISTDLDEVLELGDRVAVLFRGALSAVDPERLNRERIGELMLGGE